MPKAEKKRFTHNLGLLYGKGVPRVVEAFTKSEARAILKAVIGIPRKGRLPVGAQLEQKVR